MKLTLRPYQAEAIDALYQYWADKRGNDPIIVAPTGAGKSLILAKLVEDALSYPGTRVLMLTHVSELIFQNAEELIGILPDVDLGFYSASLGQKRLDRQVTFAGIQSIWERAPDMVPPPDLVVIDECFTGETEIMTPCGSKRIDQVSCGDTVFSLSGLGTVLAKSVRTPSDLYEVVFSNGQSFKCTGSHRIFTDQGWVEASALAIGQGVYSVQDVSILWDRVPSLDKDCGREGLSSDEGRQLDKAKILLSILCEEIGANITRPAGALEDKQGTKGCAPQAYKTRRERALAAFAAFGFASRPGEWLGSGIFNQNKRGTFERNISQLLQSGHSMSGKDDCHRIGWSKSPIKTGSRHQERQKADRIRVVSVSRVERKSHEPVYNLHVSGHPSFFANGIAVHNCHLVPKNTTTRYGKFLDDLRQCNPDVKIVGLTATPYRLDSGYLHKGKGAIFDGIAYDIPVGQLIDEGYLAPLVSKGAKAKIDLTNVKMRGGEFIESQLAMAASDPELVRATVDEIVKFGEDRKSWLVFASGIDHAKMIKSEMKKHDVDSEVVTGEDNKTDRAQKIDDFKSHNLRCLINVNVLTTGFNHKATDLVAMVRATASAGLYVQMVGRGTRVADGKENCLLLDFGGNVERHGFIDDIKVRDASQDNIKSEAPVKECPSCQTIVAAATRYCVCGHKFPDPALNHGSNAYSGAVLSTQVVAEWVDVDDVIYQRHRKQDKPDSVKVTYYCGLKTINEWLCPDHGGYAASRYQARMSALGATAVTTNDALAEAPVSWTIPTKIKIKPRADNPRFDEIVQLDYSEGRKPKPPGVELSWDDDWKADEWEEVPF